MEQIIENIVSMSYCISLLYHWHWKCFVSFFPSSYFCFAQKPQLNRIDNKDYDNIFMYFIMFIQKQNDKRHCNVLTKFIYDIIIQISFLFLFFSIAKMNEFYLFLWIKKENRKRKKTLFCLSELDMISKCISFSMLFLWYFVAYFEHFCFYIFMEK